MTTIKNAKGQKQPPVPFLVDKTKKHHDWKYLVDIVRQEKYTMQQTLKTTLYKKKNTFYQFKLVKSLTKGN